MGEKRRRDMKGRAWRNHVLCAALLGAVLLGGCSTAQETEKYLISADEDYEKTGQTGDSFLLEDKKSLYEEEEQEIVVMYLAVGKGNAKEGTDHTWTEVNSYALDTYEAQGIEPYQCEALLQVGDETGPVEGEFGYGERTANATVRLRGSGASAQQQKSYRIEIKQGCGKWEDQKVIALNKHVGDPVRIKNRLAYSLMAEIPELMSARTTFVHLYVKDTTEGKDGAYRDYGLYTQVEQINGTYLKTRGLDNDGALYQAGTFDWGRHEDSIRLATDPAYDKKAFEEYLEIKGSEDHSKLIEMLEAVNRTDTDTGELIDRYFDSSNLYYWMAFHILMGNKEVLDGNYYLYSPRGTDRWYFISWDNDGILEESYELMRDPSYSRSWNGGIFTYADPVLFRRILQDDGCRAELTAAVEDLREHGLSDDEVREKIDLFSAQTQAYLYALPDQTFARVTEENYEILLGEMAEEVEENYRAYQRSLEAPWPFHILAPQSAAGGVSLQWEEAYLHGGGSVEYKVELARDFTFAEPIVSTAVQGTALTVDALPAGQYFLRVQALAGQESQDAYEYYQTEAGSRVYSTLCFYVQADGSIDIVTYSGEE